MAGLAGYDRQPGNNPLVLLRVGAAHAADNSCIWFRAGDHLDDRDGGQDGEECLRTALIPWDL